MADTIPDILLLLERCITLNDGNAWNELDSIITPLVKKTLRSDAEEFLSWFRSELFVQKLREGKRKPSKLHQIYRFLTAEYPLVNDPDIQEIFEHFKSYMVNVIKNAHSDFLKEKSHSRVSSLDNPVGDSGKTFMEYIESKEPGPPDYLTGIEQMLKMHEILLEIEPANRVPFLLTCCTDFLSEDDYTWLSEQSDKSVHDLSVIVSGYETTNYRNKYPVPGSVIAALLGISQETVSQRVRRTRKRLVELLT